MLEIGSLFQPTQERQERLESDVNHSTLLELYTFMVERN